MIRRRLTFSNVVSFVALFVALSAGSYAAIALPKNSVGTKQLKAKAVTTAKIANHAIGASQLMPGAIAASHLGADVVDGSKVKDGSLSGADINLSTLGKVPSAAAADSAPIAHVKTVTANGSNGAAAGDFTCPCPINNATANCDAGMVVIGGGGSVSDQDHQLVNDSYPSGAGAWTVHVSNAGTGTPAFTAYAICAPAAATG